MATRDITEQELREYAEKQAETIVIRTYDEKGNSNDDRRASTEAEKRILSSIIYGGLLAIWSGSADAKSVAAACEYIGYIQMRNVVTAGRMNGYDSVYRPIRDFFDKSK